MEAELNIDKVMKRFRFQREAHDFSRQNFSNSDELRGWKIMVGRVIVGWVSNASANCFSNDHSREWYIMFMGTGGKGNIILKFRFAEDKVEEAKENAKVIFETILRNKDGKCNDFKDRILNHHKEELK